MNKNNKITIALGTTLGTIVLYNSFKLGKKYKLQKEYSTNPKIEIKKVKSYPQTMLNKEKLNKLPLSQCIEEFINVISSNSETFDFNIFNHNLETLKIENGSLTMDNFLHKINRVAYYEPVYNEIFVDDKNAIYHELFHASSRIYTPNKNLVSSGFFQMYKDEPIGNGLDEGYTQFLTERYFPKYSKNDKKFYCFEKLVASKIEEIIGKNKMENLYSHSNLYDLIEELKKYSSEEDILLFLQRLDFFTKYTSKKIPRNYYSLILLSAKDIASFVIRINCNKLKLETNQDDILEKIFEFNNDFFTKLHTSKDCLEYFTEEDELEILNNANINLSYTKTPTK